MEDKVEAGSSEGGIFMNGFGISNDDTIEEEMEVDDLMAGISNLFCESDNAKDQEVNKSKNETGTDFPFGFPDDLFKDTEQPTNNRQTSVNAVDDKSEDDSDSDSDIKFNLFDDKDDEDDDAYSFSGTKPLPGRGLSEVSKNERSRGIETKPKVDNMFPQSSSVNQVNRHFIGLSLSDSNLIKDSKAEYTGPKPDDDNFCSICRDAHTNPKTLKKCSHSFCTDCIDEYFKIKPACPECFVAYGVIKGNQPEGYMGDSISKIKLPGYEQYNTIVVSYGFSDGTQTSEHPNPGQQYHGTSRTAYLPNCPEGQKVLKLLKASFKRRLTFTIGRSRTTGADNVVTWNDVHHKTCTHGGQQNFGYPDPTYLRRVQEELAALGVTEESVNENP